jgi:endogenous inhibitor of DNA gyrase (YacG/DUF329 family)
MATASTHVCPICKKEVRARAENTAFPFCSPRCKLVDLGQWFNESYRVPAEDSQASEPGEEAPPVSERKRG